MTLKIAKYQQQKKCIDVISLQQPFSDLFAMFSMTKLFHILIQYKTHDRHLGFLQGTYVPKITHTTDFKTKNYHMFEIFR